MKQPAKLVFEFRMMVALPSEVTSGFVNGFRRIAEVGGDVMLERLPANVLQQALQFRNLEDASSTEGLERIVGELAGAGVPANDATAIVSREAGIGHGAGLDAAHTGAERVQLAHCAG